MSDEKKVWYGTLKKKLGTSETLCNSMTNIKVHKGNSGCRHRQPATARHATATAGAAAIQSYKPQMTEPSVAID